MEVKPIIMDEHSFPQEAGALWRDQPLHHSTPVVITEEALQRRTDSVSARTRYETIVSLCAAVFFVAVLVLRLQSFSDRTFLLGLALCTVWIAVTLIRARGALFGVQPAAGSAAERWATGVEFYRAELERRRKHLASSWLWHGPLAIACVLLAILVARNMAASSLARYLSVLPLLVALLFWIVIGIRQRRRQMMEIQRELEEISLLTAASPRG
jgi:hypothetical protein